MPEPRIPLHPAGAVPAGLRTSAQPDFDVAIPQPVHIDNLLSIPSPPIRADGLRSSWSPNILDQNMRYGESIVTSMTGVGGGRLAGAGGGAGGILFDVHPDIDDRAFNDLEAMFQQNIQNRNLWIDPEGHFKPRGKKSKWPFSKIDPIQEWIKMKIAELKSILGKKAKDATDGGLQNAADAFEDKTTWIGSDEGQTWIDHQLYAIMVYADASGKANAAAADVVIMLDSFAKCDLSIPQLYSRGRILMGWYGPKAK